MEYLFQAYLLCSGQNVYSHPTPNGVFIPALPERNVYSNHTCAGLGGIYIPIFPVLRRVEYIF